MLVLPLIVNCCIKFFKGNSFDRSAQYASISYIGTFFIDVYFGLWQTHLAQTS